MEFGVGSIVDGKVTGITKFGAFVALPEGRSGLVHISEIAYSYVNEVSDHLKEGQEVKVKVIGIDQNNRINLSIKKVTDPPPARPAADRARRPRSGGGRPGGFAPRPAAPKEPTDFEDRLKQFMQSSDSKLSELRYWKRRAETAAGRSPPVRRHRDRAAARAALFCSSPGIQKRPRRGSIQGRPSKCRNRFAEKTSLVELPNKYTI